MKSSRSVIAALFFFFVLSAHGQTPADSAFDALRSNEAARYQALARMLNLSAAKPRSVDVRYYGLNLRVAGQKGFLSGDVTMNAVVLDSALSAGIILDLSPSMIVDSVFVNGMPSPFIRGASTVLITPLTPFSSGQRVTTRTFYHGNPSYTGFGSYTDTVSANGARWIYTLSEPYGARDWWPCIDHPNEKADSVDIRITTDSSLIAVSNGLLVQTLTNQDGTRTYVWKERYPIATYLISLTAGNFTKFSDWYKYAPTDSMEVVNYVFLPQATPNYRANTALTPRMLGVYASLFGQYPFIKEKYGHVEFGWGGGMEHQTLTSLGSRAFTEGTIAHELAHQWFGDMITCRSWGDLWLNEGFAQYCEAVWREKAYGTAAYMSIMAGRIQDAKKAVGTLFVQDTASVNNLFSSSRVYNKGSWVLHMLRHAVGDSLFFASMRAYANDSTLRYSTASTADFRRACEQTTGRDLGWFFDEWVFGERYPKYTHTLLSTAPEGAAFRSSVRIQQTTGTLNPAVFVMPIDLKFIAKNWDTTVTVMNTAGDQTFQIVLSHKPDSLQFDPQPWILRDATRGVNTLAGGEEVPGEYFLSQNYPNPFNPTTVISFSLPEKSSVTLKLYDVVGREVVTLINEEKPQGVYHVTLDGRGLSSGVYLCRMTATAAAQAFSATRRLMLIR